MYLTLVLFTTFCRYALFLSDMYLTLVLFTILRRHALFLSDLFVVLYLGPLISHQHSHGISGMLCFDKYKSCDTETDTADQTCRSQYSDTGPANPSTDCTMSDVSQSSLYNTSFNPIHTKQLQRHPPLRPK